jgi:4-hydroxy-tetrahydrodipicolinate synthase
MTRLTGTIPALLTPFREGGREIDFEAMDAHVTWLAGHGVRTLAPLGTTGEGPSLSLEERKRVIDRLVAHPSGVGVVAGTGTNALPETIEICRYAAERGCALLVSPPWYFTASPAGVARYFRALLDALPADAQVLAYHIPSMTRNAIEDDVLSLGVAGAKDSSGDLEHTLAWLRGFPALSILNGNDASAADWYAAGGKGTLTMLANVYPDRLEAIRRGEDVDENQSFLQRARAYVESLPRHAALKELVHRRAGVPQSSVRPPLDELTDEHRASLDAAHDLV